LWRPPVAALLNGSARVVAEPPAVFGGPRIHVPGPARLVVEALECLADGIVGVPEAVSGEPVEKFG
jgi:hypothetical protein